MQLESQDQEKNELLLQIEQAKAQLEEFTQSIEKLTVEVEEPKQQLIELENQQAESEKLEKLLHERRLFFETESKSLEHEIAEVATLENEATESADYLKEFQDQSAMKNE